MTAPTEPNTDNVPKQPKGTPPPWSCKRWTQNDHDWLTCYSCQQVYQVHIEMENDKDQGGVLHWFSEELNEATACGSLSEATTEHVLGAHTPIDVVIAGVLRINPRVTCPLCLDLARDHGYKVDIPDHKTPFQHG